MIPPQPNKKLPMMEHVPEEERIGAATIHNPSDPIMAYRCWWVYIDSEDNVWLRSITYKDFWPYQEAFTARCRRTLNQYSPHEAPDHTHGCGVYAVRSMEQALQWSRIGYRSKEGPVIRLTGKVSLWGHVLLYTKGYIAEHAYPFEVYVPPLLTSGFPLLPSELARRLRHLYSVDVIELEDTL